MKIVVRYLSVNETFDIKGKRGTDALREGAIACLKKHRQDPGFKVACVMEVFRREFIKRLDSHYFFNTYFILRAAGMRNHAATLRRKFKEQFDIDLAKEQKNAQAKQCV